jgi:RHS repeat-associated protein
MLTNSSGAVLWSQRQKAFGEMVVDGSSTIVNNLRFPGQYFDTETGTHQNFWRDYDPTTGRYLQGDPVKFAGGMNFYIYALVSPLRYLDARGLLPDCHDIPLPPNRPIRRRTGNTQNVRDGDEYSRWKFRIDFNPGVEPDAGSPDRNKPNAPPRPCIALSVGTLVIVREYVFLRTGEEEVVYTRRVRRYCQEMRKDQCGNSFLLRFDYETEREDNRIWEGFSDEIFSRPGDVYRIPLGGGQLCLPVGR